MSAVKKIKTEPTSSSTSTSTSATSTTSNALVIELTKPGQRYPMESPGSGDFVFYQTLYKENPKSWRKKVVKMISKSEVSFMDDVITKTTGSSGERQKAKRKRKRKKSTKEDLEQGLKKPSHEIGLSNVENIMEVMTATS